MINKSDYRKQLEEQIEQAARTETSYGDFLDPSKSVSERLTAASSAPQTLKHDEISGTLKVIRDKDEPLQVRLSALNSISSEAGENEALIDVLLELLQDVDEAPEIRQAALTLLTLADFTGSAFRTKRADYLAALRALVDDKNVTLRVHIIEILARKKDEYVQRRLLEGLQKPSKALLPPAKAIQLLAYDIHESHLTLLKKIVNDPPNQDAKKEAVRLLGAYPSARPLLKKVLSDKKESTDVRTASATALQSLDPAAFEKEAKRIALDDEEDNKLRATCISALKHFGDQEALSKDKKFTRGVEQLKAKTTSSVVKQATNQYLTKE